jgi:hypothetical protein
MTLKKLILFLIFIFTISFNYSQESSSKLITKTELINLIKQAKKDGKISNNPVIIVDKEIILDVDRLNNDQKFFRKISIVKKGNNGMIEIYGKNAINGIIMIESIPINSKD